MKASGKFPDASPGPGSRLKTETSIEIDQDRARGLGVEIGEVINTFQFALGSETIQPGPPRVRAWQLNPRADPALQDKVRNLRHMRVKNKVDQLVPLDAFVTIRDTSGPAVIERHNTYPCVRITSNLAAGVKLAEAKELCESLSALELGNEFKMVWPGR
jgi:multidrug efflux pump subunit AcrB